jgi:predicted nucleic acid-binding Zn ribbon protein
MDRKTSRLVMYGGLVLILVVIVVVWAFSLR